MKLVQSQFTLTWLVFSKVGVFYQVDLTSFSDFSTDNSNSNQHFGLHEPVLAAVAPPSDILALVVPPSDVVAAVVPPSDVLAIVTPASNVVALVVPPSDILAPVVLASAPPAAGVNVLGPSELVFPASEEWHDWVSLSFPTLGR